jgi:hypothetical protein
MLSLPDEKIVTVEPDGRCRKETRQYRSLSYDQEHVTHMS